MTILHMKSSLAQQLSCCTCRGGAESADGSWGIGYCRWWNCSLDPPWGYHVGLRSDIGRHMRCTAPQCPHGLLAFVRLTMLWKPMCGFLEPHTLRAPYAVGWVTLIVDPTSTFVLNFPYHCGLDIVSFLC
jgi:hypothetical protein